MWPDQLFCLNMSGNVSRIYVKKFTILQHFDRQKNEDFFFTVNDFPLGLILLS